MLRKVRSQKCCLTVLNREQTHARCFPRKLELGSRIRPPQPGQHCAMAQTPLCFGTVPCAVGRHKGESPGRQSHLQLRVPARDERY